MLSYGLRWLRILFHCLVDVDESSRICFQTSAKCMQQHSRVPTTVGLSVKCLCWVPEICLSILFPGPSWGHEPNWAMAQCATTCGLEPRWRICPWTCQQPWATLKAAWHDIHDVRDSSYSCKDVPRHWLVFFLRKCLTILDISLVLSQHFRPRKKEEEEKKRKLQAMKLAKLTKTATAFCDKVALKYTKVALFESDCWFTGSDSIYAALAFFIAKLRFICADYTAYQEQQHHKHKKKKKRRRDDDSGICELKKIIKAWGMWWRLYQWHGHAAWVSIGFKLAECKQLRSLPSRCFSKCT